MNKFYENIFMKIFYEHISMKKKIDYLSKMRFTAVNPSYCQITSYNQYLIIYQGKHHFIMEIELDTDQQT